MPRKNNSNKPSILTKIKKDLKRKKDIFKSYTKDDELGLKQIQGPLFNCKKLFCNKCGRKIRFDKESFKDITTAGTIYYHKKCG